MNTVFEPNESFLRVATATPEVALGNCQANVQEIKNLITQAVCQQASIVVFPELSITGYTIQDLVQHPALLSAAISALQELALFSKDKNMVVIVGLPYQFNNALYNCAAVLSEGAIRGLVPKQNLPTYNEFYEKRWYQTWGEQPNTTTEIGDSTVPFGRQQLFKVGSQLLGIEICEDLWVPDQPSVNLVANGATIIANPSASPEAVAKPSYRRNLVAGTAARIVVGYIYSSADQTESTAEIVMGGHSMINELGSQLAERQPFSTTNRLLIADIDTQHITHDRIKNTNFPNHHAIVPTDTHVTSHQQTLVRAIDTSPFIPKGTRTEKGERLETILQIQAMGLAMRLRSSPTEKIVLGLSGGLDSTLALLVAIRAVKILGKNSSEIMYTLTMPGEASSDRTQNNAVALALSLAIPNEEIPIAALADAQLYALNHDGTQDVTYENTQARIRQALVFNKANQINGLALGTGDLSEIALGWCTYNGDHMSHYNVNASIPKTLVKMLVTYAAKQLPAAARTIVKDIVDTPVSPELTGDGTTISQTTESLIGPYTLHDFFLYHFLRWSESKEKIHFLACHAFQGSYTHDEITHWLDVFFKRFYQNQWKRQAMPDGAKVGLSLSPKGDWRMPPEAQMLY